MLRRRRAATGLLGLGSVLAGTAYAAGLLPWPALAAAVLPAAGFALWLRRVAVAEARAARAARADLLARRAERFRDFGQPQTIPAPAAAPPAEPRPAVAAGGELWTPVPLPLPTYVTAPPAPKVVDGTWHEEDLTDGELPGEATAYALDEDLPEHRPAVGD